MNKAPWDWDRQDLDLLIGQNETVRQEFKSSRILVEDRTNSLDKIAATLSAEVSAFANTEGGVIVIGISERKEGRSRIADRIDDGVDLMIWPPERLQSFIEGNTSPYLTGIRVRVISLDAKHAKGAYVLYIPQGTTAYQASDRKYYGRSEFEVKALPDHEIRLRMFRGKTPKASIISDRFMKRRSEIIQPGKSDYEYVEIDGISDSDKHKEYVDEYFFRILLSNIGEINIGEYKAIIWTYPETLFESSQFNFNYRDGDTISDFRPYNSDAIMNVNIYPQDTHQIMEIKVTVPSGVELSQYNPYLTWKLFLRDSFPIEGKLPLSISTIPFSE